MAKYASPVSPAIYPHLSLVLMTIGLFFTGWFFVYEVAATKYTRQLYKVSNRQATFRHKEKERKYNAETAAQLAQFCH